MHSIFIPLEQGLRQHYNGVHSITHLYSIFIPLEQGLRPKLVVRRTPLVLFYLHSIRTRIKTVYRDEEYNWKLYSIFIPLEQGLRLFLLHSIAEDYTDSIFIPLEQGLRRARIASRQCTARILSSFH